MVLMLKNIIKILVVMLLLIAAPTNDLQGVRAINTIDLDGLHTLGTVVVDYRGMRVTAQTIVPGM